MKGVASYEMPRVVASRLRSGDARMGKPTGDNALVSSSEGSRVRRVTAGTETSKYREEEKESSIP